MLASQWATSLTITSTRDEQIEYYQSRLSTTGDTDRADKWRWPDGGPSDPSSPQNHLLIEPDRYSTACGCGMESMFWSTLESTSPLPILCCALPGLSLSRVVRHSGVDESTTMCNADYSLINPFYSKSVLCNTHMGWLDAQGHSPVTRLANHSSVRGFWVCQRE